MQKLKYCGKLWALMTQVIWTWVTGESFLSKNWVDSKMTLNTYTYLKKIIQVICNVIQFEIKVILYWLSQGLVIWLMRYFNTSQIPTLCHPRLQIGILNTQILAKFPTVHWQQCIFMCTTVYVSVIQLHTKKKKYYWLHLQRVMCLFIFLLVN